jgi:mRNA interferase MazF
LEATILRVHLNKGILDQLSDILVDQIRAIDNIRMIKKIGSLTKTQISQLKANLKIVLDIA